MKRWLLCVGRRTGLTVRKLYKQLPDDPALERGGLVRVINDAGDSVLAPGHVFVRALGGPSPAFDDIIVELWRLAHARMDDTDPPGSWVGAVRAAKAAGLLPARVGARKAPAVVLAFLGTVLYRDELA